MKTPKPFLTSFVEVPLTRETRIEYASEIADAFEACLDLLWNGVEPLAHKKEFICISLMRLSRGKYPGLTNTGVDLAMAVVMHRLRLDIPHAVSMVEWLRLKGVPGYTPGDYRRLQAHRIAWVKSLIKEHRSPIAKEAP